VKDDTGSRIHLKNGQIVDGTGSKAFSGDLLIGDRSIERLTPGEILFPGTTLDCSGKVVAPGFIDMHSHMDWVLPIQDHPELTVPFTLDARSHHLRGRELRLRSRRIQDGRAPSGR
jgi:N-acyl-D-amino-acid deacylase